MIAGLYKTFDHWHERGTVWIYSDPHFGDTELAAGVSGRPNDETHLKMLNAKMGRCDTFICLGDVGDIEFAKRIRAGRKILICGNHDIGHTKYEEVFDEVYSGPVMIGEKLILSHEPIPGLTWAMNIHGHVHDRRSKNDRWHFNVCSDVIGYEPINFNQWMKSGHMSKIETIHRSTIDKATQRKKGRK